MVKGLSGQCLCGSVRFRINGAPGPAGACHCRQCRQWAGHFWASVNIAAADLELITGEESLAWYDSSSWAERGFCIVCGSSLFWRLSDPDAARIAIALGALDTPTGLSIGAHIFVADKGDYYAITDSAPQHATYPGDPRATPAPPPGEAM